MINIINLAGAKGIELFDILRICITKDRGLSINSIGLNIKLFNLHIALAIGKETKDGKKTKQQIKESKNINASA